MSKAWDPDAHQKAEERLCECGAAGSGEGHTTWCPWMGSYWERYSIAKVEEAEEQDRPNS